MKNELLFASTYLTVSRQKRLRVRKAEQKMATKRLRNLTNDSTTGLDK